MYVRSSSQCNGDDGDDGDYGDDGWMDRNEEDPKDKIMYQIIRSIVPKNCFDCKVWPKEIPLPVLQYVVSDLCGSMDASSIDVVSAARVE